LSTIHPNRALYLSLKYWRASGIQNLELPYEEKVDEVDEVDREADLKNLVKENAKCSLCTLCENRKNIVFGKGSSEAKIMFIGNAPDEADDINSRPFSGEAGELQQRIIEKMGLKSEEFYLTHTVKCRPADDRIAEDTEIQACTKILESEIDIIQPKVICTLGTIASSNLLKTNAPISKIRGQIHRFGKIAVMPTYHPNYLLNKKSARHDVWDDMQKVLEILKSE